MINRTMIENAWKIIAPLWPLNQAIARNPLQGFEHISFHEALKKATHLFGSTHIPEPLKKVNRQTIKWCQSFFDRGQATIAMPDKNEGLFSAFYHLAQYDTQLQSNFIKTLSDDPEQVIDNALKHLNITPENTELFLELVLATLPGWAGYIQYLATWNKEKKPKLLTEYFAVRLAIIAALLPDAAALFTWHEQQRSVMQKKAAELSQKVEKAERGVTAQFLKKLQAPKTKKAHPEVQFLFCIDVRSAPIRKALEEAGPFETFGVAGFFGLPISITIGYNNRSYAACPVLLQPQTNVLKHALMSSNYQLKKAYQSIKYTQVSPLALAEGIGLWAGIWMILKTVTPNIAARIKQVLHQASVPEFDVSGIPLEEQIFYSANLLRSIGLTDNFAKRIVVCGHGAITTNNPYHSSFNCGACAGHNGVDNARIAAKILNNPGVRTGLQKVGITIPKNTLFVSAQHNTTQQKLIFDVPGLFDGSLHATFSKATDNVMQQQKQALGSNQSLMTRSNNWAEMRPEWGLAGNHTFIIGPRTVSKHLDLGNSTFLHSYDWHKDADGAILEAIMNGPLVVAQWINAQYLFSSLNNSLYGAGNKITHNVTGKLGTMQGNASDLCLGLSYQSVYKNNGTLFHQPIRLTAVIYAPEEKVEKILANNKTLKQLVDNEWMFISIMQSV